MTNTATTTTTTPKHYARVELPSGFAVGTNCDNAECALTFIEAQAAEMNAVIVWDNPDRPASGILSAGGRTLATFSLTAPTTLAKPADITNGQFASHLDELNRVGNAGAELARQFLAQVERGATVRKFSQSLARDNATVAASWYRRAGNTPAEAEALELVKRVKAANPRVSLTP
ncbi:hypothetical protein CH253_08025 [Rhodococcus sp. 06-156-3C]|uniref:hypothetical protein n=1 Tax=Rhodococcus sp. 06-156-3C TaxID=2022486 RepID=UPI000B9B8B2B|nr:hypothetical protein [Rhodococcus sp. 06-156-3C]OZD23800.1 hypothetical protein CH253_08025 [Rhodococcus sp. 06-156-3C]